MKQRILYIIICAIPFLGLTSCNKDDLNPAPTDSISDLTAFDNEQRIEGQVLAAYATLKNSGAYGGRYQIFNDLRGGNFQNELTNLVTGFDVWNYSINNSSGNSVVALWNRAYYAINLVNVFLEGMEEKGTEVVGVEQANEYLGEVRFLRAISYYALLQLYARPYWDGEGSKPGVPLRLTANKGSDDFDLARSTVAEVYKQILDDLTFAEQNLPLDYGDDAMNTKRVHRNSAIAFKSRVYLSMGKYDDVITEASKIVPATAPFVAASGVPHALTADVSSIYSLYTTKESIFSMPFAANEQPGTQNQLGYYYGIPSQNGNGEYTLSATGIVSNADWKATDLRRGLITEEGGKLYLQKYPSGTPYPDWAPVIRYAEVLLNLAEARTRSTQSVDAQAVALLNAVRGRSDATTVFAAGDFANADALVSAILVERDIEFLGEGLSGADLTRLGLPLPAKPGGISAIPSSGQAYIWPISSNELLLNKLMTDN